MRQIVQVDNQMDKSIITECILRTLPEWFGLEDGIREYINLSRNSLFFVSKLEDETTGFISVRRHNEHSAEILAMGVLKEYHGQGLGRNLLKSAEAALVEEGIKLLQVKTLGPSADCVHYAQTRAFYKSADFYDLEEIKTIWGEDNPCLLMVKPLE